MTVRIQTLVPRLNNGAQNAFWKHVPDKLPHVLTFEVEGEKLTFREIAERCPGVKEETLRQRLNRKSACTWEYLREDPAAAMKRARGRGMANLRKFNRCCATVANDKAAARAKQRNDHGW